MQENKHERKLLKSEDKSMYPEEICMEDGRVFTRTRLDQPKTKTSYARKQEEEADKKSLPSRDLISELQSLLHRIETGEPVNELIKELQMRQLGTEIADRKLVDSESPEYSYECMEIIATIENHLEHLSNQLDVVLLSEPELNEGSKETAPKGNRSLLIRSLNNILNAIIILNERVDI